jgi:hypothetical protein
VESSPESSTLLQTDGQQRHEKKESRQSESSSINGHVSNEKFTFSANLEQFTGGFKMRYLYGS